MSISPARLALACVVAALCLGGGTAHAQVGPVSYWLPNWPIGFGGDLSEAGSPETYGNFPSFDGRDGHNVLGDRFSYTRYNLGNGWFVGSEAGGLGLSMNGLNQGGAFGNLGSSYYQGLQFGYDFKTTGGLPLKVYAGFDTLKYSPGGAFTSFDSTSGTLPGYSAHAGVEFQPTSNLSLSLGVGFTQQSQRIDSDINAPLLPGDSPFAFGARR